MASAFVDSDLNFQGLAHLVRALLNPVTSDTGLTGKGEIWFRTDLNVIKWCDQGGTVHTLANLDAVVNSVTAADASITIGGTATAPTVAVGTFTHTHVSDFDTQVRTSRIDQMAIPTATVNFNGQILTGIADAVGATDAMNLESVQKLLAQISDRPEVDYASAAALPTNTYANGTAGAGATLTATANGALSVDGQAVAATERVLVINEATTSHNGIYTVTATGGAGAPYVLTRSLDFNVSTNISTGVLIPVKANASEASGSVNDGKVFISVTPSPVVVGTSALTFSLVGSAYTAGTGLTLTGTQFSLTIPVAISSGGTGATTATAARDATHLGAQATAPAGAGTNGVVSITALGIATKVKAVIGDGTSTTIVVNHNLNTMDISDVEVHAHGGGSTAFQHIVAWVPTDVNNVTLTFNQAPAASALDCIVTG